MCRGVCVQGICSDGGRGVQRQCATFVGNSYQTFGLASVKTYQTKSNLTGPNKIMIFYIINAKIHMSYFAYTCKTEGKNGISHLISELLRTLDSSLRDCLFVLQNEVF